MNHVPTLVPLRAALVVFFLVLFPTTALVAGGQSEQELGLRLVGTAVADEKGKSFAIIEVPATGGQRAFREGDRWGDLLIRKIEPGYVVITTGKGEMMLSMGSTGQAHTIQPTDRGPHLDRKEIQSKLPDPNRLMQEIHVRPRFEGGRPTGFVIYSIAPKSIFARMGLIDGDVIVRVNGKSLSGTQPAVDFYDALKEGGRVSLEIRRDDKKQELHFEIE